MPGPIQMWHTPDRAVENFWISALQTIFSPPLLQAVLTQEERNLTGTKQHYAALSVENEGLSQNFVKIAIMEKCIAENKKTRELLLSIIHLLNVAKKAYKAMGSPWSKMITLSDGPVDVFSEAFIDTKITPFLSELRTIDPVGFTEFPKLGQDRGIEDMMRYAIDERDKVIQKAERTRQCCAQFLEYRSALNKIFAPRAYLQFRMNKFELLTELRAVLGDADTVTVFLYYRNRHYVNHTLPRFKKELKDRNIYERFRISSQRLEECAEEISMHENTIQQLKILIRGESLPHTLFFTKPKPALKDQASFSANMQQAEKAIPDPKTWNRTTLQ